MARPLDPHELRTRLADHLGRIDNPMALATAYLAHRRLLGKRDQDELVSVALESIVDAALSWDPHGGRSLVSWCWLYLDRNVYRAIGRLGRNHLELGVERCVSENVDWLSYRPGTEWYERIEARADLQRWADLAELTPYQRWVVEWAAKHRMAYVRDTPLAGSFSPLKKGATRPSPARSRRSRRARRRTAPPWPTCATPRSRTGAGTTDGPGPGRGRPPRDAA